MRDSCSIDVALFGRMTTGDLLANKRAGIHVAHQLSVNAAAEENDTAAAMDTWNPDGPPAFLTTQTLYTALMYEYFFIDVPQIMENLADDPTNPDTKATREFLADLLPDIIELICEISVQSGSAQTADYNLPCLVLAELTRGRARTLAEAFQTAIPPVTEDAIRALAHHLKRVDDAFGQLETRMHITTAPDVPIPGSTPTNLDILYNMFGNEIKSPTHPVDTQHRGRRRRRPRLEAPTAAPAASDAT